METFQAFSGTAVTVAAPRTSARRARCPQLVRSLRHFLEKGGQLKRFGYKGTNDSFVMVVGRCLVSISAPTLAQIAQTSRGGQASAGGTSEPISTYLRKRNMDKLVLITFEHIKKLLIQTHV